jgi:hypothetical protein
MQRRRNAKARADAPVTKATVNNGLGRTVARQARAEAKAARVVVAPEVVSPQMAALLARYEVVDEAALLKAIAAEERKETGSRVSKDVAQVLLDRMLEAEYQRIEGGAYEGQGAPEQVVDGTAHQTAEHAVLATALAAAGGGETDEGQALMRAAAATAAEARRAADRDRKRAARAAAKAQAAQ